jgi:protoheme IX farnesyltransferase
VRTADRSLVLPEAAPRPARWRRVASRVALYVGLTKPRIVLLLLVTTVPAMVLAAGGLPSPWLVAATLLGGTACAAGANAINQYLERDRDRVMTRTRDRPLPAGRVAPRRALAFGVGLGVAGFAFLATAVGLLPASLSLGALLFYVLVYTLWLKPTSPQNIVIGGAAGAVPPLVGWAAVTGGIGLPAVVLFAVVFLWTPPHFWSLALRHLRDYEAAGVPMLPVVAGERATARRALLYAGATVAASLALVPAAGMGPAYLASAVVLGAWFLWRAAGLVRRPSPGAALLLFRTSIPYLALLFAAVALDVLVRLGP